MNIIVIVKRKKARYILLGLALLIIIFIIFYACNSDSFTYLRKGRDHLYLNDGKHELFWFEGIHSNDPNNIMFSDIKTEFTEFEPNLVLVEGGRNENIKQTADEAIMYGESSYVAFLAYEDGVDCLTTEPPDSYVGQELAAKYDKTDIVATQIFLQIKQWQRESGSRPIDFTDMIVGWIRSNYESMFQISDPEINLEYIQNLIEPYTGFRVDDSNWLDVPADKILDDKETIVHTIWKDRTSIRNKYLIELIEKKRMEYNRIFIMMGFDHESATVIELEKIYETIDT